MAHDWKAAARHYRDQARGWALDYAELDAECDAARAELAEALRALRAMRNEADANVNTDRTVDRKCFCPACKCYFAAWDQAAAVLAKHDSVTSVRPSDEGVTNGHGGEDDK